MNSSFTFGLSLLVVAFFGLNTPAHAGEIVAYIGPGAGLGMIGSLVAVACFIGLALIAPLLYPIRLFLRWRKRRREEFSLGRLKLNRLSGEHLVSQLSGEHSIGS